MGMIPDSVVDAVHAELALLPERLAGSVLAATALELASQLDSPRTSPTAKSMVARELRETMNTLRELAPADHEENPLDEIRARRDARIGAADRLDAAGGAAS